MPHPRAAALLMTAAFVSACDKTPSTPPPPPQATPSTSAATTSPSGTTAVAPSALAYNCTVTGTIKYKGPKPPANNKPVPCHGGANVVIPNEAIITSPNDELKNAVVYISDAPKNDSKIPDPILVDQKECVYVPHVVAVRVGQTVNFTSSDPVLHNVHVLAENEINVPVQQNDQKPFVPQSPGFIKSKCDVHPWMLCYIAAFDHPYFAVTTDNGAYTIPNLPPGQYTLNVWQEKLGIKTQKITLAPNQSTTANITITKP